MRDPHVVSLHYLLETDDTVSYKNPPLLSHAFGPFSIQLAKNELCVTMKEHFASVPAARMTVEDYLRAWELDVALRFGPGELRFSYKDAEVIDRHPPPPGTPQVIELAGTINITMSGSASLHVARAAYPAPPTRFRVTPDVETLWHRYSGHKEGREPLLSMAYFCLTLLESDGRGRSGAAQRFGIDLAILGKLGEITSTRGDDATARKVHGKAPLPLTDVERAWVEAAMKAVIRRVAEFAPGDPISLIMSDLPALR